MPGKDYEVQEGDCVSSVAFAHGFFWETLWNHGDNSDLKSLRKDPNILKAGDIIHIPDLTLGNESGGTETKHTFKLKGVPAKLKLKLMRPKKEKKKDDASGGAAPSGGGLGGLGDLGGALAGLASSLPSIPGVPGLGGGGGGSANSHLEDPDYKPRKVEEEPLADADYVFEVDGVEIKKDKTDSDGFVEIPIIPNARAGRLIIERGKPTEKIVNVNLGHMDPIEEVSGVRRRLRNLGFFCQAEGPEDAKDIQSAIKTFQERNSLDATGKIDDATRDKLKTVHGS